MGRTKKEPELSAKPWCGKEGWQAWVVAGTKPDGSDDRKKLRAKTEELILDKIREHDKKMARGERIIRGRVPKVGLSAVHWLESTVSDLRYSTLEKSYGWAMRKHIIPGLGEWTLTQLEQEPTPIETFLSGLAKDNGGTLAPASVHSVYRTLRAFFNEMVRKRYITVSPIDLIRPPRVEEAEVTPLFVAEVKAIIAVCADRPNGTRWTVGLPMGWRQGEALGMIWYRPPKSTKDHPEGLDPDTGMVHVRTKVERRKWRHGCKDPAVCAAPHCTTQPCRSWDHGCAGEEQPEQYKPGRCGLRTAWACPERVAVGCRKHQRDECPELCKPGCVRHATRCKERVKGGIVRSDVKSAAGRRRGALAPPMLPLMKAHRDAQYVERLLAGEDWEEHGLVWCQPNGRPIDASRDRTEWKEILRLAGVRDARVHDGRHTAATMLLLQGIDGRIVMEIMGWSDARMLRRYQHVIEQMLRDASKAVGSLLWGDSGTEADTKKAKKAKKKKKKKAPTDVSAGESLDL